MSDPAEPHARVETGRLAGAAFLEDENVKAVFAVLGRDGEEIRVVGGAVRDAMIGEPVREVDFATTALPGVVSARAHAAGLRTLPTGLAYGTVTLLTNGRPFEITTLREDVETDGRRAVVRFGRSFAHDALRRDFTVNALSATADGSVHDYVGGLDDLPARRLRFIGDPTTRIKEDYLRSLRFLRFFAQFGQGAADPKAVQAIVALRDGLLGLSRERVRAELLKLLVGRRAVDAFVLMNDLGLVALLLGGVGWPERLAQLAALENELGWPPDPVLRLAAGCVAVVEDGERLREKLRLSNAETDRLTAAARTLARLHGRDVPPTRAERTELLYLSGRRAALDALALACIDSTETDARPTWIGALTELPGLATPAAPFGSADVLARGVQPGRDLGAILKDLQARWIRAGFPKDAAEIARLVDAATDAARKPRE